MDMSLLVQNPTGKRKKTKKRATKKRGTQSFKRKVHKKRKALFGRKTVHHKKRKRRMGNVAIPEATTIGRKKRRGTVGRKRRRATTVGRKRRSTTVKAQRTVGSVGRRRKHQKRSMRGGLGFLNFGGIFDDLLSIGAVALGGFGGIIATSYIASALFGEKVQDTTNVQYSDSILGSGVTFVGLSLLENYLRPSGIMNNLLQGAKIFTVFSGLMKLKSLFIDGKEWNALDYTVTPQTTLFSSTNANAASRIDNVLLGASYYIDDTGSTFPLGASKITPTMMGASKITPTMMGASSSDINDAISNMLSGANQPTNYKPSGIDIGQKAFI